MKQSIGGGILAAAFEQAGRNQKIGGADKLYR